MLAHGDKCDFTLNPPASEDAPASTEDEDAQQDAGAQEQPTAPGAVQLHPLGIPMNTGGVANFDAPTGPVTLPAVGARSAGTPRKLK